MTISGRRPNDRLNDRLSRLGKEIAKGFVAVADALADGSKLERINEIDKKIADLQQERDHLIVQLVNPGNLEVSDNYDPSWSKPEDEDEDESPQQDAGRLTYCAGRSTMSVFHEAHPACPYTGYHNEHEFTLRD